MFVGQENGTISQFLLSEDCNRLTPIKEYLAHNGEYAYNIFVLILFDNV
jgi:WD repeat and FYVE domain-containing protein 2